MLKMLKMLKVSTIVVFREFGDLVEGEVPNKKVSANIVHDQESFETLLRCTQ